METFWKRNTRPDGRLLTQTRPTTIQTDIILSSNNAGNIAASASVRMGDNTHVLAAVSLLVGQCTTSTKAATTTSTDNNDATSSSKLSALGGAGGDVVVLVSSLDDNRDAQASMMLCQSFLQRLLHETLDLEQLLIDPSSRSTTTESKGTSAGPLLAFRLQVTVRVLQSDGNVLDAALLAAVAALQQTQIPTNLQYSAQTGKVVAWNAQQQDSSCCLFRPLKMPLVPVPLSMGTYTMKMDDDNNINSYKGDIRTRWIVDPTRTEQDVLHNALTIVVNAREPHEVLSVEFVSKGGGGTSGSCNGNGNGGISSTDLGVAIHMATARAQEVRSLLLLNK